MEFVVAKKWLILCIVTSIILINYLLKSWIRTVYLALRLPGPPALPIFGNSFLIKDSISKFTYFEILNIPGFLYQLLYNNIILINST